MTKHHEHHSHDTPEVTDALRGEWMAQLTAELSGTEDECDLAHFREDFFALPALFMTERAYAEWYREYTHFVQSAREDDAYRARVAWGIG